MASLLDTLQAALGAAYVIERELGGGGMARVFVATESALGRHVVIKVLPPELAETVSADRFQREIQVAANLQHPHIVPLLTAGHANGLLYYTMPLVDGETLRGRLAREGELPIAEGCRILSEVARALSYAHKQGIVHRDIKPENILLSQGQAQVADFGIAKALAASAADDGNLTTRGLVLGTPAYMAPEQAAGDGEVDGRGDLYSLGVVAYETLAGAPPFSERTSQAMMAAHALRRPQPLNERRPGVPAGLAALVMRLLEKDPSERPQNADEVLGRLEALGTPQVATVAAARRRRFRLRHKGWLALAAFVTAASLVTLRLLVPSPSAPVPVRRQLTFSGDVMISAPSPDGQFVAYAVPAGDSANVVVQDLAGGSPVTVAQANMVNTLEWSPDGTRLLVGSRAKAIVVPRLGGPSRTIPWPGDGWAVHAYWLPDGTHVSLHTNAARRIFIFHLATGQSEWLPVSGTYTWLFDGSWSPDGRTFAVVTGLRESVAGVIRGVGRDGRSNVVIQDSVPLGSPHWSPSSDALFYTRGNDAVWRVPVSRRTGRQRGKAVPVQQQLETLPGIGGTQFGLTPDGRRMTYVRGARFSNLWMLRPGPAGMPPLKSELTRGTSLRWTPTVSPDGRWIGFAEEANGVAELFRMPVDGGVASQITFGANVLRPRSQIAWSPDGSQMAFVSLRGGQAQVWVASVEGGRLRAVVGTRASPARGQLTWAPGSRIAYQRADHRNIMLVDPATGVERALMGDTALGFLFAPQYAPDGARLAAIWNRSPRPQDQGTWIFDLQHGSSAKLLDPPLWLVGWARGGRDIYAQSAQTVYRLSARAPRRAKPLVEVPWRDADCIPAGPRHQDAFVCAVFDFVSDVWMIDNFDSKAR